MPEINWKVDVGHIITIVVVLAGMFIIWGQTSAKMDEHGRDITDIRSDVKEIRSQVNVIQVEQARTKVELEIRDSQPRASSRQR